MTEDSSLEVSFTLEEAENLRLHLCDVLCWMAGFEAAFARAESYDKPRLPPSIPDLREFNAKLFRTIHERDK